MIEPDGETLFSACVPDSAFPSPTASLADLSGYRMVALRDLLTYVTTTCETAWDTPFDRLSCEHVRMLVGQRCGLDRLSLAVGHFVHGYPTAEITYYPGDLTMMALEAFDEIAQHSAEAATLIRSADYGWMAEIYDFDDELRQRASHLVKRAGAAKHL